MNRLTRPSTVALGAALALLATFPLSALAGLLDHGPVDPQTGFPRWYRDHAGTALELCLAQTPSPNASAGGAPMCFPWAPDPQGYPGNLGDEQFYMSAGALVEGRAGFSARLDLALEAAYLNGTPVRGDEMVFARVRVVLEVPVPGDYAVVHPYGEERFTGVLPGPRAVAFTRDVGLTPGRFGEALEGSVGPFLEWDVLDLDPASGVPYTLTVPGADGDEVYLGDPNVEHTVKGSPFGTNFFRIVGPPGSNLDGQGNDWIETPLFSVVGKRHTRPIPTRLEVTRATYAHDGQKIQLEVFANSRPGAHLVVSGTDVPTTSMIEDHAGHYFARVVYAANGHAAPASIYVTNLTDVPTSFVQVAVVDAVTTVNAIFEPGTAGQPGLLTVDAFSSDASGAGGPALYVDLNPPVVMSGMEGNASLKTGVVATLLTPPTAVTVVSAGGGRSTIPVKIVPGAVDTTTARPVANDDHATTSEDVAIAIPVLANDAPGTGTVLILGTPANGGAVVNPATMTLDYTPKANWSGTDVVAYMVQDATGLLSNATTVTITVVPVNDPPVTRVDTFTTPQNTPITIPVLANDSDPDGAIVAQSVQITSPPSAGAAVANLDGTVLYTPATGYSGTVAFTYTVSDDQGLASAPTAVTVRVLGAPEVLTPEKVQYEISKQRWVIVGTSSVFGADVNNAVFFHNGTSTAAPVIGSANIDATGRFQWQPAPGTAAAPVGSQITIRSTGGGVLTTPVERK